MCSCRSALYSFLIPNQLLGFAALALSAAIAHRKIGYLAKTAILTVATALLLHLPYFSVWPSSFLSDGGLANVEEPPSQLSALSVVAARASGEPGFHLGASLAMKRSLRGYNAQGGLFHR